MHARKGTVITYVLLAGPHSNEGPQELSAEVYRESACRVDG